MIRYKVFKYWEKQNVGDPSFWGQKWEWVYPTKTSYFDAIAKFASECGHRLVTITSVATDMCNALDLCRTWEREMTDVVVWYLEVEEDS